MVRAKLRHQFQPQADDEPGNALANRIYLNRLRERASDRTSFHNKLQTRRRAMGKGVGRDLGEK